MAFKLPYTGRSIKYYIAPVFSCENLKHFCYRSKIGSAEEPSRNKARKHSVNTLYYLELLLCTFHSYWPATKCNQLANIYPSFFLRRQQGEWVKHLHTQWLITTCIYCFAKISSSGLNMWSPWSPIGSSLANFNDWRLLPLFLLGSSAGNFVEYICLKMCSLFRAEAEIVLKKLLS